MSSWQVSACNRPRIRQLARIRQSLSACHNTLFMQNSRQHSLLSIHHSEGIDWYRFGWPGVLLNSQRGTPVSQEHLAPEPLVFRTVSFLASYQLYYGIYAN